MSVLRWRAGRWVEVDAKAPCGCGKVTAAGSRAIQPTFASLGESTSPMTADAPSLPGSTEQFGSSLGTPGPRPDGPDYLDEGDAPGGEDADAHSFAEEAIFARREAELLSVRERPADSQARPGADSPSRDEESQVDPVAPTESAGRPPNG